MSRTIITTQLQKYSSLTAGRLLLRRGGVFDRVGIVLFRTAR